DHFVTAGRLENIALDQALAPRPDLATALKGAASVEFNGQGDLGDFNYTLQTLAASGKLALANLQFTSVNVLAEIARRGGFEAIGFDEPGTHVDHIEGSFQIKDGRLGIENLALTGINGYADARAEGGWIDLKTPAAVDIAADVTVLPPFFEKAKKASPLADVVLTAIGANGSLTVPLAISGPLESPAVAVRWDAV